MTLIVRSVIGAVFVTVVLWTTSAVTRTPEGAAFAGVIGIIVAFQFYCFRRALPFYRAGESDEDYDGRPSSFRAWVLGIKWSPLPNRYQHPGNWWLIGWIVSSIVLLVIFFGLGTRILQPPTF